ncbi:CBS domain-containing protein [Arenibaculum pallidiluteum]|uniref:CBS domain-containing protein n=1 Tax=Arenibaculum pallidiluteum TaxID=2812559 RepID=UPI001A959D01|nr:CBS domain-containing protein [Arenibaculum pallidiluteum]
MPQRKLIPDLIRDQQIITFSVDSTVLEAVDEMARRRIGAVLIVEGSSLVGIFTERDVLTRVIARRRDPASTRIDEVMTRNPDTLPPDARASDALDLMRTRNYRHLPVVANGRVVGIVSIRDLYAAVQDQLEADILGRDTFIHGGGYGLMA